ncbi:MAG: hypothetical protein H6740_09440 [Alphaproteobacteria bacterium]|nr:hypothetical protein [Alphaproteobacteria bacterium]
MRFDGLRRALARIQNYLLNLMAKAIAGGYGLEILCWSNRRRRPDLLHARIPAPVEEEEGRPAALLPG